MIKAYLWSCRAAADVRSRLLTMKHCLNAPEIDRAGQFKFEEGRALFVAGRSLLRTWLGLHNSVKPAEIEFRYHRLGKPSLANSGAENPAFSYSHSGEYFVCSVISGRCNGIDIERVKGFDDLRLTAQTIMNSQEYSGWVLDSGESTQSFFTTWTRKESLGKLTGTGISTGPRNIPVPMDDMNDHRARVVPGLGNQPVLLSGWSPFPETVASLAIAWDATPDSVQYEDEIFPGGSRACLENDITVVVPESCQLTIRRFTA